MGIENMSVFAPKSETPSTFIEAMACAATPVSIVTTDGAGGRFGITVSAVSSVSADPPMVLACIKDDSPAVTAIEQNGRFCINLLNAEQSRISNCFAGRPSEGAPYDFQVAKWQTASTGAPVLEEATASFDCLISNSFKAGTHRIFIGLVQNAAHTDGPALAYSQREYKTLAPLGH